VRNVVATAPEVEIPAGFVPTPAQAEKFFAMSLRRLLDAVFEDEASLRILLREAVGLDVQFDTILHAIDDIVIERFSKDLDAARAAGVVRADVDTRAAALFVMGGIQKLALDSFTREGGNVDLDDVCRQASKMTLTGLLTEKALSQKDAKP
jgi:hypothetical protein